MDESEIIIVIIIIIAIILLLLYLFSINTKADNGNGNGNGKDENYILVTISPRNSNVLDFVFYNQSLKSYNTVINKHHTVFVATLINWEKQGIMNKTQRDSGIAQFHALGF